MKRTGFARPQYTPPPPAPVRPASRRAQMVASTWTGSVPKEPADRNPQLLQLAAGEACCGCQGERCPPETTVWAHTNRLADRKGRGYKGHDSAGMFLGVHCHDYVDGRGRADTAENIERFVEAAQGRTCARLHEIANSLTMYPWKQAAARLALQQMEARRA